MVLYIDRRAILSQVSWCRWTLFLHVHLYCLIAPWKVRWRGVSDIGPQKSHNLEVTVKAPGLTAGNFPGRLTQVQKQSTAPCMLQKPKQTEKPNCAFSGKGDFYIFFLYFTDVSYNSDKIRVQKKALAQFYWWHCKFNLKFK